MNKNIREHALVSLSEFISSDLKEYSSKRNYDYGPSNRKIHQIYPNLLLMEF